MKLEVLKKISEVTAVSGHERGARAVLKELVKDRVSSVGTDPLGNLLAHRAGDAGALKVMVAAHMDEVGILVRKIDDKGFLRFVPLGSLRPQVLLGQRVRFTSGLYGIIAAERLDDMGQLDLKHLYIDIGAKDREQAQKMAPLGSTASFCSELFVRGHQIVAKALDDRIGCYIMLECLEKLGARAQKHDYLWAFTAQEEVGVRGAQVAAQAYGPDFAVIIDVTPAGDTPNGLDYEVSLGGGATIKIYDFIPPMGGFIAPPGITEFVGSIADKHGIKWQPEVLERGSTDASSVHLTGGGVPCAVISVPIRYSHSPYELIDSNDVTSVIDLVLAVLEDLTAPAIQNMLE